MKINLLILLCVACTLGTHAQTKKKAKKAVVETFKLKTKLDSASYAYGLNLLYATSKRRSVKLTQDLKERGLTKLNYAAVGKAIEDELNGQTPLLTPEQSKTAVGNYIKTKFTANLAESNRFMADNKTKPGVITQPSGLQYIVITPGSGPTPKLTDTVTAHYVGINSAGKEFDNSYKRNTPIVTATGDVIKGWTEGLQLMTVGSKYRFFIPYQLAYGDMNLSEEIQPYTTLIFDVELLKITPAKPAVQ